MIYGWKFRNEEIRCKFLKKMSVFWFYWFIPKSVVWYACVKKPCLVYIIISFYFLLMICHTKWQRRGRQWRGQNGQFPKIFSKVIVAWRYDSNVVLIIYLWLCGIWQVKAAISVLFYRVNVVCGHQDTLGVIVSCSCIICNYP